MRPKVTNFVERLVSVFNENLINLSLQLQNFFSLNNNVRGLTGRLPMGLMDHNAGIRKRMAHPGAAGGQQKGAHAGRLSLKKSSKSRFKFNDKNF